VTSCIVDSAAIYIMAVKFRTTICPPPLQLSLHRRAALSSKSNETRVRIWQKELKKESIIVRCLLHEQLSIPKNHTLDFLAHAVLGYLLSCLGRGFHVLGYIQLPCCEQFNSLKSNNK
jgi:hypothetical protein